MHGTPPLEAPRLNEPESTNPETTGLRLSWLACGLSGGIVLSGLTLTRLLVVKSQRVAGEMVDGVARPPSFSWSETVRIVVLTFVMGFACGLIVRLGRGLSARFGAIGDVVVGILLVNALLMMCLIAFEPEVLTKPWGVLLPLFGMATGLGTIAGFFGGRMIREEYASAGEKPPPPRDTLE